MKNRSTSSEGTPIEGEFTSDEMSESAQEETFVDLSEFMEDEFGTYKIKKGDSLLLISFRVYRDYQKWWVFKHFNPGLDENILIPGSTLKYPLSKERVNWRPKGNPYLILNGDTLTGISLKKYRDALKWTKIWDNNKILIKDPDNIFAGFTIFYVPDPHVIELVSLSQMGKIPVYKADLVNKKVVKKPEVKKTKAVKVSKKVEISKDNKQGLVTEEEFESSKVSEFEKAKAREPSSGNKENLSAGIISDEMVPSESSP